MTENKADFSTLVELYGSDEDKTTKGVPVHIGLNRKNDPVIIYVAEAGNPNHKKSIRKYERTLASSRHNRKKIELTNAKIVAESILMGWEGIIDVNGDPVEANLENRIQALVASDKFFIDVIEAAQDPNNFSQDGICDEEDTEGNSEAS